MSPWLLLWGREWQHSWGMLTRVSAYHSSHPAPDEHMIESHASIPPSSPPNTTDAVRRYARCTAPVVFGTINGSSRIESLTRLWEVRTLF